VKLGVPTGKITTTLLGGSVAIQDARGRSEISPLYGLRTAWNLKRLSLNASQLLTPAASDEKGKFISALSLSYTPVPTRAWGWKWRVAVAEAVFRCPRFTPANN
jgi:hypothetical protein